MVSRKPNNTTKQALLSKLKLSYPPEVIKFVRSHDDPMKNNKHFFISGSIALVLLFLDLFTKWFAYMNFRVEPFEILSFFKLNYTQNSGIAWSLQIPQIILIPLNILILAAIPFFAAKNLNLTNKISQISLALIISGAIGNIYDRLAFGYVRDFISVGWWPIFNLADSFLCIGIFLIIGFYGKIKRN